jgi:hypothetical protein
VDRRDSAGGDPSDADLSVLSHQLANSEPLTPEEIAHSLIVDTQSADWQEKLNAELSPRLS